MNSIRERISSKDEIVMDKVDDVSSDGGKSVAALSEVSFSIHKGVHLLLGPSGCGKTTLLRIIAVDQTDYGQVLVAGDTPESARKAEVRNHSEFGVVRLRSVRANIQLPLEVMRVPKPEWKERIDSMLELVDCLTSVRIIINFPRHVAAGVHRGRWPSILILLMDEPFPR